MVLLLELIYSTFDKNVNKCFREWDIKCSALVHFFTFNIFLHQTGVTHYICMGQQGSHSDPSARVAHESTQSQSNDSGSGTNQKSKIFKGLASRGKSKVSGNSKISKKQHNSSGPAISKPCGTNALVESLPSVAKDLDNSQDVLALNSHYIDRKVDDYRSDLGEANHSGLINPELKFDKGLDDFDELFCDARDSHSPNDETPYMSAPENGSSMELSIYDNPTTAMSSSTLTPVEDLKVVNVPIKLDKVLKSKLVTKDTSFTLRSSHSDINAELSQSLMCSDSSGNRHDDNKCSNIFSSKFGYSLESGMEAANISNLYQVQNNNENINDGGSSITLSSDLNNETHDLKQEMDACKTKHFQPYKRHTSLNDDSDHSIAQMRTNGRKSHVRCSVNSLTFASLEEVVHYPKTVPEKLDFKQLDKFEGQMLISWLCSCFSESSQMDSIKQLSSNDFRFLSIQFCTYLLAAGVIRKMEEKNENKQIEIFKPDLMYYWAHTLALQTSDTLPGKLNVQLWPFSSQANASAERPSLGKPSAAVPKKEMIEESNLTKKPSEMTMHFVEGDLPQIAEYEQKLKELKQEVEKYRILSGIESLNCVMTLSSESSNNKHTKDGLTQTSINSKSSETQTSDFFENICKKSLCERATSPIEDLKAFIFTTLGLATQNNASKSADISLQTSFPLDIETGKSINFCKSNLGSADQLGNSSLLSVKATAPLITSSESLLSSSSTQEYNPANIPQELYSMTHIPHTLSNPAESVQQMSQTTISSQLSIPALPTGSIPPPPSLPALPIPPPPSLPDGSIPPPPPLPALPILPPPSLPALPIPPPSLPALSIPPPPPLPDGSLPFPPPLLALSIPPPPPLPALSIPPPPPFLVGSVPPPPPLPVGSVPLPPPLPDGSIPLQSHLPDGSTPYSMLQSNAVGPSLLIQPFGPSTSTVHQVPRKPAVLPKAAMKPLFWKRIQVPAETVHESDASPTSQCLWNILQEPEMDFAEFEDLFAKAPTKRKNVTTKKEECKKTREVVKLLDSKKSQALGIFITSLHLNVADIETALLEFDPSVLSTEMLSAFYEQRPEESEVELVRNFLAKHPDSILDRPEQFIYELSQIPCFDDRCYCFIFQTSFFESLLSIEQRLINVKMIVENIMCNPDIETIFGLILALGNYMNGGTARGQADGFGLDILSKLKDVKSKDNTLSLLEYIIKIYLAQHVEDGSLTEYVPLPIPEPSDVLQAANVNFDDLHSELVRLDSSLDGCELKIKRILSKSTKDTLEPFQSKMRIFMSKAKIAMNDQENNIIEVKKKYESCVCFFMANSQRGDDNFMSLKDFFGLWVTFCQDFKDVWKKEMQRIAKLRHNEAQERVKKMQEEKKVICMRMPVNKSGLKAKLTSKGII